MARAPERPRASRSRSVCAEPIEITAGGDFHPALRIRHQAKRELYESQPKLTMDSMVQIKPLLDSALGARIFEFLWST